MKIVYFDCFSGISGDMILGALLDAGLEFDKLNKELQKLGLENFEIQAEKVVKQNITSTKFNVLYEEEHHHRHLSHLNEIVDRSDFSAAIKEKAKTIFLAIARAEAKSHNMPIEKVHFHEVGAIDTIIDVVGVLAALQLLGIEKVYSSSLNVGSGFVTFSHGKFPVPAPATAEILKGVPIYNTDSQTELVTPTGAAIITTLAKEFGEMPAMITETIGYGAGSKDLPQPNVLRVYLGNEEIKNKSETVQIIETNIDDMNPQLYEHVMGKLLQAGALDVFLTNTLMKKSRPGILLTVLAKEKDTDVLLNIIFSETTSIGVRMRKENRAVLKRSIDKIETSFGSIRVKKSAWNGRTVNVMPEFEDMKKIAAERGIPLKQLYDKILSELSSYSLNAG